MDILLVDTKTIKTSDYHSEIAAFSGEALFFETVFNAKTFFNYVLFEAEQRIIIQMHSIQYPQTDQYCCDIPWFLQSL